MASDEHDDPFKRLCDRLRKKKGLAYRQAVVDDDRLDYFRGKDVERFMKKVDEVQWGELLTEALPGAKTPQERAYLFMRLVIERGLVVRVARTKTKPAKGKTKLSAWPKQLTKVGGPEGKKIVTEGEDAFYGWTYERPIGALTYILGGLVAVLVVLACLFPLAPYSIKLATVYVCYFLLTLILGVLVVRVLGFLAIWIVTGRHIWLLPNLLRDDLGVIETFSTLISVDVDEKGKAIPPTGFTYRVATLGGLVAAGYALYTYDGATITVKGAMSMHDSVLDFIDSANMNRTKREAIGGAGGSQAQGGARGRGGMPHPSGRPAGGFGNADDFIKQGQKEGGKGKVGKKDDL